VHLIISIIIGIVFGALFIKAIIETVWGTFLITYGFGCKLVAVCLRTLAKIIRLFGESGNHNKGVEEKSQERVSIVSAFNRVNELREQSDRLSPAHQNRKTKACLKQH
jgi:hypothetical protein